MTAPSAGRPGSLSAYQKRPSNVANVCPRQKSGWGARTRMTMSFESGPRIEVSNDSANPGYPPSPALEAEPDPPRVPSPTSPGKLVLPSGWARPPGAVGRTSSMKAGSVNVAGPAGITTTDRIATVLAMPTATTSAARAALRQLNNRRAACGRRQLNNRRALCSCQPRTFRTAGCAAMSAADAAGAPTATKPAATTTSHATSHIPRCPSTRSPLAYVATTTEMARFARAARRSMHSKPYSTTSSISSCGSCPRSRPSRFLGPEGINTIAARPASAGTAISVCTDAGIDRPVRSNHDVTVDAATAPPMIRPAVAIGVPNAPHSMAMAMPVAAAVSQRARGVSDVSGSAGRRAGFVTTVGRAGTHCALHAATDDASGVSIDGLSPMAAHARAPRRCASSSAQRQRPASSSRSAANGFERTIHRCGAELWWSCTTNVPLRNDEGQCTDRSLSPSRHGRMPSSSSSPAPAYPASAAPF